MELNVFYKFAFISLLSTTILPFIIGIAGIGSKKVILEVRYLVVLQHL